MNTDSFIGKLLCAVILAAALGWFMPTFFGSLIEDSAATEVQINGVKAIAALAGAALGGWLGWVNSQLIITGTIFSMAANMILGIFNL